MPPPRILLLGPLEAPREGGGAALGGGKQRAALALLALEPGRVVSADALVEELWGADPPPTAATALQGHVSRLRRILGADAIETRPPGYVLHADTDAAAFEAALAAGDLDAALELWRGAALADVPLGPRLADEARRLEELRLHAREELFARGLAEGRHVELVPELETFLRAEPYRERALELLMLALYRSGRQADALETFRRTRADLRENLGLEPGPAARELQRRILEQDPALAPAAAPESPVPRRTPITVVAVVPATVDEDTEAYVAELSRARELARLELERHGGLVQRAGSGLVGLYGIPVPREDDAARALEAARAAVAAAGEAGVGVASGEAFMGESPAVDAALRLAREAAVGAFVADPLTHARARARALRLDRPLAGRDAERERLASTYAAVAANRTSAAVTIAGPAGIGKSRLAGELLARVAGEARVLATRCLSYGDGIGFLPLVELVRAIAGEEPLETLLDAEDVLEQLRRLLGADDAPPDEDVAAWAVRRLLESVSAAGPTVVYVDDVHWASQAVLRLVEQLAEPAPVPLLLVTTSRNGAPAGASIDLAPLGRDACAALVASVLGGEAQEDTVAALADASGGNPLFLEELVADLRAAGRLRQSEAGWQLAAGEIPLPSAIESLLAARLERLPEREREVLGCASVVGGSFTLAELVDLAGDDLDEPLAALMADQLLQPARVEVEDLEFRHLLFRDAAYAALPLAARADLHRRHARSLEERAISGPREREALVVYHLDQAHRALAQFGEPDDPAPLARRMAALGRETLAGGDVRSAVALLTRVLELDDSDPLVPVDLGRAHLDLGDFAAADAAFARSDSPRARLGRLDVLVRTDPKVDFDAAAAQAEAVLPELKALGDERGLAEAWTLRASVALFHGSAGDLGDTTALALADLPPAPASRAHTWLLFLSCAVCWYGPMRVEDGIRRCEGVLAAAQSNLNLQAAALQSLGVLCAMSGDFARGRALVAQSRGLSAELGQRVNAAGSAIDAGIVELLAGEHAAAEALLREGYDELATVGETAYFSTVAGLLAEAIAAQGRLDEARAVAAAAREAASADDVVSQVEWRTTEARALAAAGDAAAAEALGREGAARADETDFLLLRAEAWAAVADVTGDAGARAHAVELLERKGLAPPAVAAWARA
ncbi:MAG TPA: BTAD domain-containing putative transcriptional regulator [Gaiellaceae bacterium]|nr:BTAD domain-containing putative transcriptional regulator [Gaiellaceae bacterium]